MSGSPSWDYQQPPAPDRVRAPGDTSEPLGYDPLDLAMYEQPPEPPSRIVPHSAPPPKPYSLPAPAPRGTLLPRTGFALSIIGAVTGLTLPVVTVPLAVIGLFLSAVAWRRSRRNPDGRGYAIGGVILGLLGVAIAMAWIVFLMSWPPDDF